MTPLHRQPTISAAERDLEHERLVLEEERRMLEQDRIALAKNLPPSTEIARQIIQAGRRRRGEDPDWQGLPEDPAARAVVLSGQKRRNEISEPDAIWLDSYLRGSSA